MRVVRFFILLTVAFLLAGCSSPAQGPERTAAHAAFTPSTPFHASSTQAADFSLSVVDPGPVSLNVEVLPGAWVDVSVVGDCSAGFLVPGEGTASCGVLEPGLYLFSVQVGAGLAMGRIEARGGYIEPVRYG